MPLFGTRWPVLVVLSLGIASCGQENVPPAPTNPKKAVSSAPSEPAESAEPDAVRAGKPSAASNVAAEADDPDAAYRKAIVGVWKQSNTGTRWLRIRPDGTGIMYIDPDWVAKAIIGDALTMKIDWSIDDGRAVMNSVSGKPKSAFKAVSTLFGHKRNQPIVELNEERFVLKDEEDGSLSAWTRVEAGAEMPEMIERGSGDEGESG